LEKTAAESMSTAIVMAATAVNPEKTAGVRTTTATGTPAPVETIRTAGAQGKPTPAITSVTAESIVTAAAAGILWDASSSRDVSSNGTPATASSQATLPIRRPQKCPKMSYFLEEMSTFGSPIIESEKSFLVR
jgi:hypothetical protein